MIESKPMIAVGQEEPKPLISPQHSNPFKIAEFEPTQYLEIPPQLCVVEPGAISKSFFYPIFKVTEWRNAWGNLVMQDRGTSPSLQKILERLRDSYRAGSTLSVDFKLGFAFVLKPKRNDVSACLLYENSSGITSYLPHLKTEDQRLRSILSDLTAAPISEARCVELANQIFGRVGRVEHGMLLLHQSKQRICKFTERKFLEKEAIFINRKLQDPRYCNTLSKAYDQDACRLQTMNSTEIEHFQLDKSPCQ